MKIANRIGLLTVVLVLVGDRVPAQGLGFGGRSPSGGYGPGMENLVPGTGVGPNYLPSGGGFLPYTPGPGGGLGVQSRMSDPSPGPTSGSMAMPGAPALGGSSGPLSPLAPITGFGGMKGGSGMGSSRLLNRPAGPGMRPMQPRPPVGYYPFQIPPSLRGPGAQGPAMSM